MTLIEPDMNLRMPDISTTVETLNLISKMEAQKENIRSVIAPEHKHKYKDIENGLKGEEKVLIEQMAQHCEAFKANFKGAAQGDWVKSAMSEIDSIKDDLKKLIAKLHIILLNKAPFKIFIFSNVYFGGSASVYSQLTLGRFFLIYSTIK